MSSKSIYQSKTFWVGAMTLMLSILGFLSEEDLICSHPTVVAGIGMALGVGTIVLRFLTHKPVHVRKAKKPGGR